MEKLFAEAFSNLFCNAQFPWYLWARTANFRRGTLFSIRIVSGFLSGIWKNKCWRSVARSLIYIEMKPGRELCFRDFPFAHTLGLSFQKFSNRCITHISLKEQDDTRKTGCMVSRHWGFDTWAIEQLANSWKKKGGDLAWCPLHQAWPAISMRTPMRSQMPPPQ